MVDIFFMYSAAKALLSFWTLAEMQVIHSRMSASSSVRNMYLGVVHVQHVSARASSESREEERQRERENKSKCENESEREKGVTCNR